MCVCAGGLPPELAADPGMRQLATQHAREMAVMRMEIDRARSAAELEQIKAALNELRRQAAPEPRQAPPPPPPPPPAQPQDSPHMMDVPRQQQAPPFFPPDTAGLDSDDDDDDGASAYTEDDTLADQPALTAPGTVVKADVMHVGVAKPVDHSMFAACAPASPSLRCSSTSMASQHPSAGTAAFTTRCPVRLHLTTPLDGCALPHVCHARSWPSRALAHSPRAAPTACARSCTTASSP
jgi:hypothetical protein